MIDVILPEASDEMVDNASIILLLDIIAKANENGKISADLISEFKSKNGGIKAFDKVIVTLDVRNSATAGSGVTVGDIAGYKAEGTVVDTLFDADALSISYDANNTTADFNLLKGLQG